MEHLCKCLNCGSILFDKNPQTGAPLHDIEKLQDVTKEMELLYNIPNDTESAFWGCPVCRTDDNLIDM